MRKHSVLWSAGDPVVDGWVRESVAALCAEFGARLRAVFVIGSRVDGTAVATSDLDLLPVLRGKAKKRDRGRMLRLKDRLFEERRIPLDGLPVHDGDFPGWSLLPLREASRLAWGEDVRGRVPAPSPARAARWALFAALHFSRQARDAQGPVAFPLAAPDPEGRFLGYDRGTALDPGGREIPSTRSLVSCVGRAAAALVTVQGRTFVPSKAAAFRLYPETVDDGWTGLVVAVDRRCRGEWEYRIPVAVRDRAILRDLCERGLAFENHAMEVYRDFLLEEMRGGDPEGRRIAAEALTEIAFPGDGEIRSGLEALRADGDAETRESAKRAIEPQGPAG